MTPIEPSFDLIERMRPEVARRARRTPLEPSPALSERTGREVFLKCENLQRTGSFKIRGATAKLASLSEAEKARGVLAASAGNHGQGVALVARELGIEATIHVPAGVPRTKLAAMRRLGARVVVSAHRGYDAMEREAMAAAEREGKTWISPYDDPFVVAGAGTVGVEIFEDAEGLDAVVVPVGGGGLAIGIGLAARRLAPRTRILGVNTSASPAMALSFRDGRAYVEIDSRPTIAEGLEGGVSERAFALARRTIDDMLVVDEESLPGAIARVLAEHRFALEGSAAVGPAALLEDRLPADARRIAIVLSGGNIDYALLRRIVVDHPLDAETIAFAG